MDFVTYKTGVSWTERDGEARSASEQRNYKLSLGIMTTSFGLPLTILQFPNQAWEGHTINGTATTSALDFQNKLNDAIE